MEGTEAFLAKYNFVDSGKVGNLGASYGGFMTMLLATKTDMFSASIAHAGISNLTSYWGEGWWGYLYSGEASKITFRGITLNFTASIALYFMPIK